MGITRVELPKRGKVKGDGIVTGSWHNSLPSPVPWPLWRHVMDDYVTGFDYRRTPGLVVPIICALWAPVLLWSSICSLGALGEGRNRLYQLWGLAQVRRKMVSARQVICTGAVPDRGTGRSLLIGLRNRKCPGLLQFDDLIRVTFYRDM